MAEGHHAYFMHALGHPLLVIVMNFSMGDIADIITHSKFYVNGFSGLGVLTHSNMHYSMD